MSKIPDKIMNVMEVANDSWLELPIGVQGVMRQSNWLAGFCEGYKKGYSFQIQEKDKQIEDLKKQLDARTYDYWEQKKDTDKLREGLEKLDKFLIKGSPLKNMMQQLLEETK